MKAYILTEQNCSICFTAAAAAADAWAFFLLRADPITTPVEESRDPGPDCPGGFRFQVALRAVAGPPPVPVPPGADPFEANFTTAAAPLLFTTVGFSPVTAALGGTSARSDEKDVGTNDAGGAAGNSTGGFRIALGSDKI